MRLAANAPRFAARFLFTNPAIAIGAAVLTAWIGSEGISWNETEQRWEKLVDGQVTQTVYGWQISGTTNNSTHPSIDAACTDAIAFVKQYIDGGAVQTGSGINCQYRRNGGTLWNVSIFSKGTQTITVQTPAPVGDQEFEDELAPIPLPSTAPNFLPIPLPVEAPKLNPIPLPDGAPSPLRIPTGDPYAVPNTNPQRYERPVTDIVPSPTPTEPWRMDLQPRVIEVPSLDPNAVPTPNPATDPVPEKAPEEQPDLCEKNPDILACSKPELDTPTEEIPKKNFAITYVAETLFGTGSCPANKTMALRGQQITVWDFQQTCDLLSTYLRPMVILLATFSAFLILSPGQRE